MIKHYFSNGFSLAIFALVAAIEQADAFAVQPRDSLARRALESQPLFALPKIVKKGEKVVTEPDVGGVVQALGFLGAGAVALGVALTGPQNGDIPPLNLPAVNVPSKSSNTDTLKLSTPSVTKKTEKKITKAKKMSSSFGGYDLDLDEVRPRETKATFDRQAVTKEADEARNAAKAKSKAAAAEKQAASEARKQAAEARRNKLAEEKAQKEETRARAQAERAAKLAEAKDNAAKERESAAAARKTAIAKKEVPATKVDSKVVKADQTKTKTTTESTKEEDKIPKVEDMKPSKEKIVIDAEPKKEKAEKAPPTPMSPTTKSTPKTTSSGAALGKVSGTSAGGQILQKEEVSDDVINMLKKYK